MKRGEVQKQNKCVLSVFLNVDNVGAERMSSGRLFHATGPATQNARLPSCSLVLGTTKLLSFMRDKCRLHTGETNTRSLQKFNVIGKHFHDTMSLT